MRVVLVVLFLFLLCGVEAFAELQPPVSSRWEKKEQPIPHPKENKEATAQSKVCTEFLASITELINAQNQENTSDKTKTKHDEKFATEWWKVPDVLVAIFTGLLTGATGILALFTYRLWNATKTMVDETARSSIRQASETQSALKISRDAANSSMEQTKIATEGLQRSNRAWIGLIGPVKIVTPLTFDGNSVHCKIRLSVKNIGVSPAINTCSTCELIVKPYPSPDPRTFIATVDQDFLKMATNNMGITVIPGEPIQLATTEIRGTMPEKRSDVSVWLNGYFGYRDEFEAIHYSSFFFSFVTPDGERKISPNKIVKGRFESFGIGWLNT